MAKALSLGELGEQNWIRGALTTLDQITADLLPIDL